MNAQWKRSISVLLLVIFIGNMLPYKAYSQTGSDSTVDPVAQATAQPNRIFLPVANALTCSDQGYAVSKAIHRKGMTLGDIADDYYMNPHDLWTLNKGIFELVNNVYTLQMQSPVCMPKVYKLIWNQANGAYVKLRENRDRWNDYLLNPPQVEVAAANANATRQDDTFIFTTPTFPITGKLFQVVGDWFFASGAWGGFVARVAPGSFGAGLLKGVGTKIGYAVLAASVGITTANAVHYPATGLKGGAYMFYYQVLPANGKLYGRCYNEGIPVGERRTDVVQMLIFEGSGTDQRACLLTSTSQESDQAILNISYGWRIVQQAVVEMMEKKSTSDLDAAQIISDLEDYYAQKETGKPIAIVDGKECGHIVPLTHWILARDLATLTSHMKYMFPQYYPEDERLLTDKIARIMLEYEMPTLIESYEDKRPRQHGSMGMATSRYGLAAFDSETGQGHYFNVDVQCTYVSFTPLDPYKWINVVDHTSDFGSKSMTESGAVIDIEKELYHDEYKYKWTD